MTREQLRQTMPNNEFHMWRAYYTWRAAMQELAAKEATVSTPRVRRG